MVVQVANGASIALQRFQTLIDGFKDIPSRWLQKFLEMGAYDLVLGIDWLEKFSPMAYNWLEKWLEFQYNGSLIRLQGITAAPLGELQEVSAEQVVKWNKGNDLWAVVLLEPSSKLSSLTDQHMFAGVPSNIKDLIHDYESLFHEPKALPPSRTYDHAISLIPNATPVNFRPYRYSSEQKDEIERQVQSMLEASTIVPSLSPFASPVLLVKKKDNSCRFCVDYRKLNNITMKNKFSLPIIDEFLDETAGAKYFSTIDLVSGFHQNRLVSSNEFNTAFKTHHGHFQF
jgi:hypothetical protein